MNCPGDLSVGLTKQYLPILFKMMHAKDPPYVYHAIWNISSWILRFERSGSALSAGIAANQRVFIQEQLKF